MSLVLCIEKDGERSAAQTPNVVINHAFVSSESVSAKAAGVILVDNLQLLAAKRAEDVEIEIICDRLEFGNRLFVVAPVCRALRRVRA